MADKKDIFYLDKVFPEAEKIFSESFKTNTEIIKDGIIVLDTNVLLIPFDTNEKNVLDIKTIYQKYKSENRLFIPARVAREFANNRATRIGNIFLRLRQLKDNLNSGNFKIEKYPILQNNTDYNELLDVFENIQTLIKTSRKHLENLEKHIQSWTWDDIVSQTYKEIFTPETIVEVEKSKEELEKDLAFRIEFKVAPGFKDSGKPDDGVGDLVIWQTLMEIAKERNKDLIFVSNDNKNDWFYKQDKIALYPKYELFDEFRRFTDGKSIAIIDFVKFLELSNAKADTIKDIKCSIVKDISKEYKAQLEGLIEGMFVEHQRFGRGKILSITKEGDEDILCIFFEGLGKKMLMRKYARLKKIDINEKSLLYNTLFDSDLNNYRIEDYEDLL